MRPDFFDTWRLLPWEKDEGASHMALDHALLEAARNHGFPPTLRFMRWDPPAISLGRFQEIHEIDLKACREMGIEVVRRPTGGKSILHLGDFTYSIVLPSRMSLPASVVEAYTYISRGIVAALHLLGLGAEIYHRPGNRGKGIGACFASSTQADLRCGGRKICGSAQLRKGGALLQHGSLLLEDHSELLFRLLRFEDEDKRRDGLAAYRRSCVTLAETGVHAAWEEVAACFIRGFSQTFQVHIEPGGLTDAERERWRTLTAAYRSREWLHNRRARALPPEGPYPVQDFSVKIRNVSRAVEEDSA